MAITSTSGVVNGSDVSFDQSAFKGQSRGLGIMAYFDYILGGSDTTITIAMAFNDAAIDSDFYDQCEIVAGVLTQITFDLPTATGKYRLQLPNGLNEDNIKLTVGAGLINGDLNIEFRPNQPFA